MNRASSRRSALEVVPGPLRGQKALEDVDRLVQPRPARKRSPSGDAEPSTRADHLGGARRSFPGRALGEQGGAIVLVMVGLLLLSALGLGLVLLTMTETLSTANTVAASQVLRAAEAGVERVMPDLVRTRDWDAVLGGSIVSSFVHPGSATLADGRVVVPERVADMVNCGRPTACSSAVLDAVTEARPWGRNNPRWRVFGFGPLAAASTVAPDVYVVVLVADDPFETDNDPTRDGRGASPGAGVLLLRAEAFGATGAHRVVEAAVARPGSDIGESGYASQRGRARTTGDTGGQTVQTPGGTLRRVEYGASRLESGR